jgi:[glutamine synthetase] adenylyltransferase / [glutamine synthetase]-adenylyl-L-tyrosine phosphorylase
VTPTELADAIAKSGARDARRVADAAAAVATWLAAAPAPEVAEGLAEAGDPAAALDRLARLLDTTAAPPEAGRVAPLLRLLGGSQALAATLVGEGEGWSALVADAIETSSRGVEEHRRRLGAAFAAIPPGREDLQRLLRRHRRRELVRIGGRDLLGLSSVDETVRELSMLAEASIEAAVAGVRARLAAEWGEAHVPGTPRPAGFVVLGMGKLGGEELNYSSDVDLVYVYECDGAHGAGNRTLAEFFCRLAEDVTRAVREPTGDGVVFRVDLRLRPGGAEGPVAISLPAALAYYETWGQTWERAAWLKARAIAGDRALGDRLAAELSAFVYRRYLDFGTIEDLTAMKRRVDASLRAPGAARDVKLGRGGIREVEFFVQAHQLIHGGKDARLRVRGTLAALAALADAGYVARPLAERLAAAYRFLRDVEHKLQVVDERQTQLVPSDPDEVLALARRVGFRGIDAAASFEAARARETGVVREAFEALFHGAAEARRRETAPELALLVDELDDEERAVWRLAQLGFRDVEAAYADLRLLRDGPPHAPASARRRQALASLAPTLLAEIARSAAPDRALRHVATFISTIGARTSYLHLLLENPGVMRLLVRLFATSEFLSAFFLRHPELLDSLVRADLVRLVRTPDDLAAELSARLAAASDLEAELDTLRRFRHEEFLRIGVHDIEGTVLPDSVGVQLTALAETCLRAALAIARREVIHRMGLPAVPPTDGLAVVGMGKLGSGELTYASDLDLIFVYDPGDSGWWGGRALPHDVFTRIAQRTISALQTPTPEGIAYRIDTRLRPSGNQGPLVTSLEAFAAYHATSAQLWERQALIRARVVAGPDPLARRLEEVVTGFVYGRGLSDDEAAEIARMRARIEHERAASGGRGVNIKTGRGGLVDVEFLVQALQLRYGGAHVALRTRRMHDALAALERTGILPPTDARALAEGHAFLHAMESRLRLESDQPVDATDVDDTTLATLARRLGYTGADVVVVAALRADHARHRDAIRAVYDRHLGSMPT